MLGYNVINILLRCLPVCLPPSAVVHPNFILFTKIYFTTG